MATLKGQSAEGVYHIPLDQQLGFDSARSNLLVEYNSWFSNLNPRQRKYMTTNEVMKNIDELMKNYLNIEPKDLAEKELKLKGNKIVEITQGNEKPALEKAIGERGFSNKDLEKQMENYVKKIDKTKEERLDIQQQIPTATEAELKEIIQKLSQYATDITVDYNNLDDTVKLGVESKYNKLKVKLEQTLRQANANLNKFQSQPKPADKPADKPAESKPFAPVLEPEGKPKLSLQVINFNDIYKENQEPFKSLLRTDFNKETRKELQRYLEIINNRQAKIDDAYNRLSPEDKKLVKKGYFIHTQAKDRLIMLIDNALNKPRPADLGIIRAYIDGGGKWDVRGSESIGAAVSRVFGLQEETKINNITGQTSKKDRKEYVKKLLEKGPPRVEVAQQEDLPPINFSIYEVD